MGGSGGMKKNIKVGIVVVIFDGETKTAIREGEAELEAPRFPLIEDKAFRDACLIAFRNAGGDRCHQT